MKPYLLSFALAIFIYVINLQTTVDAQLPPGCTTFNATMQGGAYPLLTTNRPVPSFFLNTSTKFNFTTNPSQCKAFCIRKPVRQWTRAQFTLYGQLWNEANKRGWWKQIQSMHALDCNCDVDNICAFHFNKAFMPWHRFFLAHVEQTLQNIDHEINPGRARRDGYEFCLGYWDWGYMDPFSNDLTSSTYKYIFSNTSTGTLINGTHNITDGPFKNLQIPPNSGNYTQRAPTPGTNTWNTATVTNCLSMADQECNGNSSCGMSPCVENSCHAGIHLAMGVTMLNLLESPGDPDFFLHHSMIDYIWWVWQHNSKSFYPTSPQWNDTMPQPYEQFSLDDSKDYNRGCFTYQPQSYVGSKSNVTNTTGLPSSYGNWTNGYKTMFKKCLADGRPGVIQKDLYVQWLQSHSASTSMIDKLYNGYLDTIKLAQYKFDNLSAYYNYASKNTSNTNITTQSLVVSNTTSSNSTVNTTQIIDYANALTGTTGNSTNSTT